MPPHQGDQHARQPVVDCWALNPDNLGEYLSLEHCRVSIERLCPRKGDVMVTNRRRPVLKIMEDTAPGTHDTLLAACDRYRYELLKTGSGLTIDIADNTGLSIAALKTGPVPALHSTRISSS